MLKILQWNCRSVLHKKDMLSVMLSEQDIDAFVLCETWLAKADDFFLSGYNLTRSGRDDGMGGGVLVGVKKTHAFYKLPIPAMKLIEATAIQTKMKGVEI